MKRNLFTSVLLMIFTCGIYCLYLVYKISKEVDELTNDIKNNALIDLLLTIITGGLYTIYWFYKISKQIEEYEEILTMNKSSIAIITTIIAFILYPYGMFISMAIILNEINKVIDEKITF